MAGTEEQYPQTAINECQKISGVSWKGKKKKKKVEKVGKIITVQWFIFFEIGIHCTVKETGIEWRGHAEV